MQIDTIDAATKSSKLDKLLSFPTLLQPNYTYSSCFLNHVILMNVILMRILCRSALQSGKLSFINRFVVEFTCY